MYFGIFGHLLSSENFDLNPLNSTNEPPREKTNNVVSEPHWHPTGFSHGAAQKLKN